MKMPVARRRRVLRVVLAGAATVLMAASTKAQSALHPPMTLDTGLVVLVPGEAMVIRGHASTRAKSRVTVRFYDAQDHQLASSIQVAEPGQPTMARLPYESVPGTGGARVMRAETQIAPLAVLDEPTPADGTIMTVEAYGDTHSRAIPWSWRPDQGGGGRDTQHMVVPQLEPGYQD